MQLLYFDAASGHRSAAIAICKELKRRGCEAEMLNLVDVCDRLQPFGRVMRMGIGYFNACLQRDCLFDLKGLVNLQYLTLDCVGKKGKAVLSSYWQEHPASCLVSVTPMCNELMSDCYFSACPQGRYLCIPVDIEEAKKRYWFIEDERIEYLLGSEELQTQASSLGIPPERMRDVGGMPADPDAYEVAALDRNDFLQQQGLDPERPLLLVSFGGQGAVQVKRFAEEAQRQDLQANVLFMCGRNQKLFQQLEQMSLSYPHKIFSYLPEPPIAMIQVADYVIGKPGSVTLAESQVTGTPLLALKSTGLALVQRGNERWIEKHRAGRVFDDFSSLVDALPALFAADSEDASFFSPPPNHAVQQIADAILA